LPADLPLSHSPPLPISTVPRSAYIHVPFCRHRCGYCNFTLVAGRDDLIDAYLDALTRELSGLGQPQEVDTLFLGGGTPTHLPPKELQHLFAIVGYWFPSAPDGEVSVEANPRDLFSIAPEDGSFGSRKQGRIGSRTVQQRLVILGRSGVTRISLGAQSFDERKLKLLERDHDARVIIDAFNSARQFANSVSLDLIFGIPGESLADWQRDLAQAIALAPDHLSTYGLTFEKGTAFWSQLSRGSLARVEEDVERQMYELAIDMLTAAGYEHYEVSNFARPGHRCRHNEAYWTGQPYFAAGPGAARFVGGRRETNHRSTTTYIRRVLAGQSPVAESEELGPEDAARERLVFALRRLEGIDKAAFAAETSFSVEQLGGQALARLIDLGLLDLSAGRLKLTRKGLLVSDAIWPEFLRV
jgi:oxygen-independent coproporphyrinogen-3 oxidase